MKNNKKYQEFLDRGLIMTNSKKYQEFLDSYLLQGYSYEISSELAIKDLQQYYRGL